MGNGEFGVASDSAAGEGGGHRAGWLAALILRGGRLRDRFVWAITTRLRRLRRKRRPLRAGTLTAAGLAMMLALGQVVAQDDKILVAKGDVAVIDDGRCSLIEAIENANDTKNGRVHDDCAAGNPNGADVIQLANNALYELKAAYVTGNAGPSGTPWITSEIEIRGKGSTIQRAADAPDFRLMQVGRKGELTLMNAKLSNGHAKDHDGGAILNQGGLTVKGSELLGNQADGDGGALFNAFLDPPPTMIVESTSFQQNVAVGTGGAIGNLALLTVASSEFSDNSAKFGGGVGQGLEGLFGSEGVDASLVISETVMSGNSASWDGGGIFLGYSTEADLSECTLSGNSASFGGGLGATYWAGVTIEDCLIVGNDGGGVALYYSGATIERTTVSSNSSGGGGGIHVL